MSEVFLLKEEIFKLTLALKVTEERLNSQTHEIQAHKKIIGDKETRIQELCARVAALDTELVDERANSKLVVAQGERKADELQQRLREKEKEAFVLRSRAANGENLSIAEMEKQRVKNELEVKFGAEAAQLRTKVEIAEAELKTKRAEVDSLKNQVHDQAKISDIKVRENAARMKLQIGELKEAGEQMEVQILSLKSCVSDRDFQIQRLNLELQGRVEAREGEAEAHRLHLEKQKKERADAVIAFTAEVSKLRDENRKLKLERDKTAIESVFLANELKAKNEFFSGAETEIAKLKREKNLAFQTTDELESDVRRLKEDLLRKAQKLESLENEYRLKGFREQSELQATLEIEKRRAESAQEQLIHLRTESEAKNAAASQQINALKEEMATKSAKMNAKKARKAEMAERMARLELENHKLRIEVESSRRSTQEMEEALQKTRMSCDETESVRRQAGNILVLHKEIDVLKEKLAEAHGKIQRLKSRFASPFQEVSEQAVTEDLPPEQQEPYEQMKERIRNELYGYTATRFCDTHERFVHGQMGFGSPFAPNNFTPAFSLNVQPDLQNADPNFPAFETTLPKAMSSTRLPTSAKIDGSEIKIVDQRLDTDFSFATPALVNVAPLGGENSTPMKERLAQMIRSGDYIFTPK